MSAGDLDGESRTDLTHLAADGSARMVDVGSKEVTQRVAVAEARVRMSEETAQAVARGNAPKGDVISTARLAGIQAAKRTADLIPLAHPLPLDFVEVTAHIDVAGGFVTLTGEARTTGRTGVELEALTAATVSALTVYDMVKGMERGVEIERIGLVSKAGGRSGDWVRGTPGDA
jgi:cyclic pyranopterin monophosphate synthase